jgi:hypothetical protein
MPIDSLQSVQHALQYLADGGRSQSEIAESTLAVEVRTPLLNLLIVPVVLRARFLHRQQTEDDDDHEHDRTIRKFRVLIVLTGFE